VEGGRREGGRRREEAYPDIIKPTKRQLRGTRITSTCELPRNNIHAFRAHDFDLDGCHFRGRRRDHTSSHGGSGRVDGDVEEDFELVAGFSFLAAFDVA
jgi:hypothetical protein